MLGYNSKNGQHYEELVQKAHTIAGRMKKYEQLDEPSTTIEEESHLSAMIMINQMLSC